MLLTDTAATLQLNFDPSKMFEYTNVITSSMMPLVYISAGFALGFTIIYALKNAFSGGVRLQEVARLEEKESTAQSEVSHEADQDSNVHDSGGDNNESKVQSSASGQESEKENKEDSEEKSSDSSSESSEDSPSPVEDEEEEQTEDKTENNTEEDSETDSDASESTDSNSEEETTESTTEDDSESSEGAESDLEEDLSEEYTTEEINEPVPVMVLQDGTVAAYGVDGSLYPLYTTYEEFMESPVYVTRYENEILNRLEFIQYALALLVALIFLLIFKKKQVVFA